MGMLQGKVMDRTFVVIDAFALPVEGTETRVNAQAEAYEFMVDFAETCKVRIATGSRVSTSTLVPALDPHDCLNPNQVTAHGLLVM